MNMLTKLRHVTHVLIFHILYLYVFMEKTNWFATPFRLQVNTISMSIALICSVWFGNINLQNNPLSKSFESMDHFVNTGSLREYDSCITLLYKYRLFVNKARNCEDASRNFHPNPLTRSIPCRFLSVSLSISVHHLN